MTNKIEKFINENCDNVFEQETIKKINLLICENKISSKNELNNFFNNYEKIIYNSCENEITDEIGRFKILKFINKFKEYLMQDF